MGDVFKSGAGRGCPHPEESRRKYSIGREKDNLVAIWCRLCGERIHGQYPGTAMGHIEYMEMPKRGSVEAEQVCLL